MSSLPEAIPCPDKPPLHLRGGYLCVAAPLNFTEACFSAPAVRALRALRPNSTMVILCPRSQEELWKVMPELDDVIVYPGRASTNEITELIKMQKTTFESSIVWEVGNAAKAFKKAKIYQRLGYPIDGLLRLLTDEVDVVNAPGPIKHRVRHYLDLVSRLCGDAYVPAAFQTPKLPEVAGSLSIVISPNSSYGASYEWPVERFHEVMTLMNERYENIEWLIISDFEPSTSRMKKGKDPCNKLKELINDSSVDFTFKMERYEVLGHLEQSSALLACDGELAHLAAHLGLPAVVIFGPNESEWKRPLGKQSQVLREHVACSPCYLTKCPIDHRCQTKLTADMAVEKLEASLKLRG